MTRRLLVGVIAAALLGAEPAAAAPLDLGRGLSPDVAVDAAGTAHVVLQAGSSFQRFVDYCQILKGGRRCAIRTRLRFAASRGRPRILRRSDGLLIITAPATRVSRGRPTC